MSHKINFVKKVKNRNVLNGRTDFLVMIIEFEIEVIKKNLSGSVVRMDGMIQIIEMLSYQKCRCGGVWVPILGHYHAQHRGQG